MQPLRPADPSTIAGFRLLGRLGAGGMGVVYLARSAGGALAALKLIRAEHAADPGFRERFRREARVAESLAGRWVVKVLGSDPEAREPWLATEFVPGPSLAEAVAVHGPLPEATVRALGRRLAEALGDLHRAGLVHRDVKPANVLLALDGPRLIDFGIARSAGATALTATDAMIGTPGFLSPEQARVTGAGEVGPASDVFSLGCVLAHASTGRRPFGTGSVAAVVYRTVHEEPDLDGLPPRLSALVGACLAKDPASRPTAPEVRAALSGSGAPRDPRIAYPAVAAPPAGPSDPVSGTSSGTGPEGPAGDWLPPGLPALIAQRSSRVLDLPVAEPTVLTDPPGPAAGPPSRRRFLVLGSAAAVAGAGGLTAWLANRPPSAPATGGPPGPRRTYGIGVQTDLSGPRQADGRAQERGVRLAVETLNARADRLFDLSLTVRDDAGDPRRAAEAAKAFVGDAAVMAVIGPTSRETVVAGSGTYHSNRVALLSVAIGVDQVDIEGQTTTPTYRELRVHQDMLLMPYISVVLVRRARRMAVVHDRAAGDFAWRTVKSVRSSMLEIDGTTTEHRVPAAGEDFAPAVREALATRPDAVFYAGASPRRAGLCARELARQGYTGLRGSVEYALGPEFLSVAGPAADGWYFGTTYVDPALVPKAKAFTAAYRTRWGLAPSAPVERYAAEAYDVVLGLGDALRELVDTHQGIERGAVRERLRVFPYQGITKTYGFDRSNPIFFTQTKEMFLYRVERGVPRFLGQFEKAAQAQKKT
ncbi:bifunctional serine/threonine-protein kinase/ABC transporter substrate-binding protein [Streptomyces sp. NPDC053755]|uniref:bifunctional serine/threonine-protein kinase/ABC transporter substrate-binding protein n=1 Tax=Streptomyces sp. NPDC053755 TaxID=3155815 RepID=UPI00341B8DF6